MSYTTDKMKLQDIEIAKIKPEIAPLPQEKALKRSILDDDNTPEQWEEVKVRTIKDKRYTYELINGRRRVETLREAEVETVRGIVVEDVDDATLHLGALIGNGGTPNAADEANHCVYLRDEEKMTPEEIAHKTGIRLSLVKNRLRLKDRLAKKVFDMLLSGEITYTTAYEFTRISNKEKQRSIARTWDKKDGKLTPQVVKEYYQGTQKRTINDAAKKAEEFAQIVPENDVEKFVPPVILTNRQMEKLINDEAVNVVYDGVKYCLMRCEL